MGRDWSLLPFDIAASITLNLEAIQDFIRFSAVCRSWNRASSLIKPQWRAAASPVPWLLLPEKTNDNPNFVRKFFDISNNKFYQLNLPQTFGKRCWGSAYGWVAMVGCDLNVQLFNPITKAQISFPSFEAIIKGYEANIGCGSLEKDFLYCCLNKLIVIQVSQGDHHEFVIVVLYRYNQSVAYACHGDQTWTSIIVKEADSQMFDVVVMGDNVFALYLDGSIVSWNVKEFRSRIKPIVYSPRGTSLDVFKPFKIGDRFKVFGVGERGIYLVHSGGDLLMVLRYKEDSHDRGDPSDDPNDFSYETLGFRVFRLDHKHKNWKEIEELDNVVLFLGENYSISVALKKSLKRNCIYFTDDLSEYWFVNPRLAGLDMGIYNIKNGERLQLYDDDDVICPLIPSPFWFVPQF